MSALYPVHPFPARMAPEFALEHLPSRSASVLDPMMGSGTIPILAALRGHNAYGFDTDPLALLIARVWGRPLPKLGFLRRVERVVRVARSFEPALSRPVVTDEASQCFIDFWFDEVAQVRLAALAAAIRDEPRSDYRAALWCTFSRLIITKDAGASRARDVSHSRPHRVRESASFDPIEKFAAAASAVLQRHEAAGRGRPTNVLRLGRSDARALPLEDETIDFVMTSPPYVNAAIDYMRSHQMSLVWMGYNVADLRQLRQSSIGSSRASSAAEDFTFIRQCVSSEPSSRCLRIVRQYADDIGAIAREIRRVLRPSGRAVLVVADGTVDGARVHVGDLVERVAVDAKLEPVSRITRPIQARRRYLPPPGKGRRGALDERMKEEICLTFAA